MVITTWYTSEAKKVVKKKNKAYKRQKRTSDPECYIQYSKLLSESKHLCQLFEKVLGVLKIDGAQRCRKEFYEGNC